MNLNNLIFPAPTPSYTSTSLPNLIWVPRSRFFSMKMLIRESSPSSGGEQVYIEENSPSNKDFARIPCYYQKYTEECKNLILYFHGNAEDLGQIETFIRRLSVGLKANVLSVEYPGYGIYEGEPSAEAILEDAEIVYDFLLSELKISSDCVMLLGKSIGSAPAIHLGACRKAKMLALISPFTSVKDVVKSLKGTLMSHLVMDIFKNVDEIKEVECPVLFVHGQKDEIVPVEHSKVLMSKCKATRKAHFPKEMTHNQFSTFSDIIQPIRLFCYEVGFETVNGSIEFPDYSMRAPVKERIMKKASLFNRLVSNITSQE